MLFVIYKWGKLTYWSPSYSKLVYCYEKLMEASFMCCNIWNSHCDPKWVSEFHRGKVETFVVKWVHWSSNDINKLVSVLYSIVMEEKWVIIINIVCSIHEQMFIKMYTHNLTQRTWTKVWTHSAPKTLTEED